MQKLTNAIVLGMLSSQCIVQAATYSERASGDVVSRADVVVIATATSMALDSKTNVVEGLEWCAVHTQFDVNVVIKEKEPGTVGKTFEALHYRVCVGSEDKLHRALGAGFLFETLSETPQGQEFFSLPEPQVRYLLFLSRNAGEARAGRAWRLLSVYELAGQWIIAVDVTNQRNDRVESSGAKPRASIDADRQQPVEPSTLAPGASSR